MADNRWTRMADRVVFYVCDAFLSGHNAEQIARVVHERFDQSIRRTQVYQVVAEGRRRGYFQLTPPRDEQLAVRMTDRFVAPGRATDTRPRLIKVVNPGLEPSLASVAIAAAETALEVITDTFARLRGAQARGGETTTADRPPVHVGLGAGATMMLVARYLAERLRAVDTPPPVVLHALSSGFNVQEPANAPVAFFSFFHGIPGFEARGLFGPPYVRADEWERTRELAGVCEAFAQRDLLHVVITSLASREDEDGELNRFMRLYDEPGRQSRTLLDRDEQRVGDVMYRPFSLRGPITRDTQIRAVTLFELTELVQFASDPDKAVILVSGPCGSCDRPRDDALMPLLTVPSLAVWSHLVTDEQTASNCLDRR